MKGYALIPVVALAIAMHPATVKAAECNPQPLKCPAGQTLYYSASNKSCPSGNYLCRPAAVAKPAVATTTTARPKQAQAKPIAAKPAAKAAAVKKPAVPVKPRTDTSLQSKAAMQRQLDEARGQLEQLLTQVSTRKETKQPEEAAPLPMPVTKVPKKSCSFGDRTISDGRFLFAYESASVGSGESCKHQIRTCDDGELSGSYEHAECTMRPADACIFGGVPIADGGYVTAYQSASVAWGSGCVSEMRLCENGVLSGSFMHASCKIEEPSAGSVLVGQSVLDFAPPQQQAQQAAQQAQAAQEAQQRANLEATQRAQQQAHQTNVNVVNNAVQNAVRNAVNAAIPRIR